MDKIKAYFLRVDEQGQQYQGYIGYMEDVLENLQEYVGGSIDIINITDETDCIINDEGKLNGLPYNRAWRTTPDGDFFDILVGNLLCIRHDGKGGLESIREEDIPEIEARLVPVQGVAETERGIRILTYPAKYCKIWGGDDNVA